MRGGILNVIGGLILVLMRNDESLQRSYGAGPNFLFWTGIGYLVSGVVVLLVAKGLADANGFSRFLVAALSFVQLVFGLYGALTQTGAARTQGIVGAVIALVVLSLLFTRRANAFFRAN